MRRDLDYYDGIIILDCLDLRFLIFLDGGVVCPLILDCLDGIYRIVRNSEIHICFDHFL